MRGNMDLKKNKKLKKKYHGFKFMVNKFAGFHLYRSKDKDALFSDWERITGKPQKRLEFSDSLDDDGNPLWFYKYTEVDIHGKESEPKTPKGQNLSEREIESREQNPLNEIAGYHIYRSTDRNLPLDQWERRNEELLPTTGFKDEGLTSGVTYYYYVVSVNVGGLPSLPSEIISATAK